MSIFIKLADNDPFGCSAVVSATGKVYVFTNSFLAKLTHCKACGSGCKR